MRQRKYGILSLDLSAASSGWTFSVKDQLKFFGLIKTNPRFTRADRLTKFRKQLVDILKKYKPSFIVIENGFGGRNIKTLKVLSEFSGVAKQTCMGVCRVEPYVMSNKTIKKHFGVKTKEELFEVMVDIYENYFKDFKFEKDNDITDAFAQSVCFYDTIVTKTKGKKKNGKEKQQRKTKRNKN